MKRMRTSTVAVFLFALLVFYSRAGALDAAPPVGSQFPDVAITVPDSKEHRNYLGLKRGDSFKLFQVATDTVIVEVLSMYCPFCQAEAPAVNTLYSMIEGDPELRGKVKIIGIAAGNTKLERDMFVDKFDIPFPVFADGDFLFHKALGEVRTPYFFGVRIADGAATVFYSNLGAFDDPASFLSLILERSRSKNTEVSP